MGVKPIKPKVNAPEHNNHNLLVKVGLWVKVTALLIPVIKDGVI